jgi:hypothetical protein
MIHKPTASDDVIDVELWRRALPAIDALRNAALKYIGGGGWCLQEDYPKVSTEDRPWPWLEIDKFSDNRPNDWASIFGYRGKRFTQVAYEDVPELMEFREYSLGRQDLRGTLLQGDGPETELKWLNYMNIDHLSLDVFERSMHVNASDEVAIRSIYAEAERSVLQPTLRGDLMVPLVMTPFGERDDIRISDNLSVVRLSEELQRARAHSYHNDSVHVAVLNAATHALVLENLSIDNIDPWSRQVAMHVYLTEEYLPILDRFITSLRVLTTLPIGYAQILLRPHDWADRWRLDLPALSIVKELRQYPDILDDGRWRQPVDAFTDQLVTKLPTVYRGLVDANKRLAVASRRLDMARKRPDPDDIVIDCAVGLEAMLGGDRTEMAHRIATRAAILLRHKFGVEAIYSAVRGIYNRRSEIVHGSQDNKSATIKLPNSTMPAHRAAPFVLAEIVQAAIEDPAQMDIKGLDRLALSAITKLAEDELNETESDPAE